MALIKEPVRFNFSQGLESFTDPTQLAVGRFTALENSVFVKNGNFGALQKRNGFNSLTQIPGQATNLATYQNNLYAFGSQAYAYNQGTNQWLGQGAFQPLQLDTLPVLNNQYANTLPDVAISPNNLLALAISNQAQSYQFQISDLSTGQNIIPPTAFSTSSQTYVARVFYLNGRFVWVYDATNSGTGISQLYYFTYNATNLSFQSPIQISSATFSLNTQGPTFDGVVNSNTLFLSIADLTGIKSVSISSAFAASTLVTTSSFSGALISTAYDTTNNQVWVAARGFNNPYNAICVAAYDNNLNNTRLPLTTTSSGTAGGSTYVSNLTSYVKNGIFSALIETNYNIPMGAFVTVASYSQANYINRLSIASASAFTQNTIARSLGLASKPFLVNNQPYYLTAYQSTYQNTYFLNGSGDLQVARLAYGNGTGYTLGPLPSASVMGSTGYVPYLVNQTITNLNKQVTFGVSSTVQTAAIYSNAGVGLAKFTFGSDKLAPKEISQNLHLNGGFLWSYDGVKVVENNFLLYPDRLIAVGSSTAGNMTAQTYFYQFTYEWTDAKGNIHYSAPSVPQMVTLSGATTAVLISVPVYRPGYKGATNVGVGVYRWSQSQQVFFKLNNLPYGTNAQADIVPIVDTLPDSAILGNQILYTNGGVNENSCGPASNAMTVWDSRLWMVDAEDPNLLWYSKAAVESTPLEMSGFQTFYVEPNIGAQGPTGGVKALCPMDDKLVLFKKNAIYYITGQGPDDTGANSTYAEPTFVTATVGCQNPNSIVQTPLGLMFQSDKGIWLLSRDISTSYIGKDVEAYNQAQVLSAQNIPGTNQIRFSLDTGVTLVFDYFINAWATFTNVTARSSVLYQDRHTYVDQDSLVFQETPGSYADGPHLNQVGSQSISMRFQTGWIDPTGLQGYQRAYKMYMLGQYKSPHTATVGIAYNYDPTIAQTATILPTNTSSASLSKEQWQVNFQYQQIQSFQLTFTEVSSSTSNFGPGLVVNGFDLVIGKKQGWPMNVSASNKIG